jgi:hypothetical protein
MLASQNLILGRMFPDLILGCPTLSVPTQHTLHLRSAIPEICPPGEGMVGWRPVRLL